MAEAVPASPLGGRGLHQGIIQWLVDNFCVCEGFSVPRCLMYEIYVETCGQSAQNQVNPATFGKLVRLVFPDLGTRRLGTRGSARYHYDGIYIKKSSFFYSHYCYLLGKKSCHSGDAVAFGKSTDFNTDIKQEEIVVFLADEYCNYCQDILQNVRNQELEKVEELITSFWKSLQQDTIMLMSLPDVRQLFGCYDMQLFKGLEDTLLPDFLEDVSIQYLKSVRLFSKRFKLWLLSALEGFPAILQISKLKEVTRFVKRLRRKTYLSNMAKTMKMVLKNNRRVGLLKSDLRAIISEGTLDISKNVLAGDSGHEEDLESHTEMKCLGCLISLLETSTDLAELLNCVSSSLQELVFQRSKSKEEFVKLASSFQLRWNFLLTAVSKAMTLSHRDSFGAWHLFHLLLLEYVIHILESFVEEEEEEEDLGSLQDLLSDEQFLTQPDQALFHPLDTLPMSECASRSVESPQVTLKHMSQSCGPMGVSSMVLQLIQVLLEDKATESTVKLSLPVGQEALITLSNGQRFVIHISDVPQSSENTYSRKTNANMQGSLLE
ncbi:DNA-binding protein RFX8 [Microtus ochrogaster]|uniref:DNA-binding protein RFX8 n=1 Tax=Microtus ochrogaster TaxID=79684 RepID=A0A8J6G3X7_MICOH|nr:DNA-binding protein RFX8 [Microtus ochrogaster]